MSLNNPSKILVIAAHPDDEVLGCGGTIARLASEGHEVNVLILGEGVTSREGVSGAMQEEMLAQLRLQSQKVGALLGVKDVVHESLPDNRFDSVPLLDIVHKIEAHVAALKPAVVYTQHGGDLNIDHQITFKATMAAVRPMSGTSVNALYAYEVASSTEWAFGQFSPAFKPSLFVDISSFLEKKLLAMAEYTDESRNFPHPRSSKALTAQVQKWGVSVGYAAAEAFEVVFKRE